MMSFNKVFTKAWAKATTKKSKPVDSPEPVATPKKAGRKKKGADK